MSGALKDKYEVHKPNKGKNVYEGKYLKDPSTIANEFGANEFGGLQRLGDQPWEAFMYDVCSFSLLYCQSKRFLAILPELVCHPFSGRPYSYHRVKVAEAGSLHPASLC